MLRPPTLTSKQKKTLRALAHHLDPLVVIGKEGLGDGVIASVDRALEDHELIKVRVLESSPDERAEVAPILGEKTEAHVVGVIGRVIILYRRHPKKPKVAI